MRYSHYADDGSIGVGIFTSKSSDWRFIANGVGVVDAGGGGIIHCTGGTIALALCIITYRRHPRADNLDHTPGVRESIRRQEHIMGSCLFWAGFALVHGVLVSDASFGRTNSSPTGMVNSFLSAA